MSQSPSFDFSVLGHQGSYFSSFTPLRIEEYLRPPFLPPSAYHLVACRHPHLLARSHTDSILTSYLAASQAATSKIIVDLCLPFHDEASRRTFLARYIVFEGSLVGVRLSTNVRRLGPQFSAWPRHKSKVATVRAFGKSYSITIGQIAIYLGNLRMGLLFESELETSAQEYLNCGFEMIALSCEGRDHEGELVAMKEGLSRQVVLLEGGDGQEWEAEIGAMLAGEGEVEFKKGRVFIQYYSFEKLYTSKRTLYLSESEKTLIAPLEINHSLFQKPSTILPVDSLYYELVQQRNALPQNTLNRQFSKYLQRLYLFHRRSGCRKIVVMLQDTPQLYCFLYLINLILDEKSLSLRRIFKFVDLSNTRLVRLLHRFTMLRFEQAHNHKKVPRGDPLTKLIRTLDFLAQTETRQSFFPIITANPQTVNVLRMMNEREKIRLEWGEEGEAEVQEGEGEKEASLEENSCECITELPQHHKTWIATGYFSEEELRQIYFSQAVRQIVDDDEWHRTVWERHLPGGWEGEESGELGMIEEKCLAETARIEDFLQRNVPFMHEFETHYNRVRERNGNRSNREMVFSHFLFRKITVIDSHPGPSVLHELLATSEASLLSTYYFLHGLPAPLRHLLSSRIALNSLALARQQFQNHLTCHLCGGSFQAELMFACTTELCRQKFCYECLVRVGAYSEEELFKEQQEGVRSVKLCPVCRGLCIDCGQCEEKRAILSISNGRLVNKTRTECHCCRQASRLFQFSCSECELSFCLPCIQEGYRSRTREYEQPSWRCFVCQRRCFCNRCEAEKRQLMAVERRPQMVQRKGILKNGKRKERESVNQEGESSMQEEGKTNIKRPFPSSRQSSPSLPFQSRFSQN